MKIKLWLAVFMNLTDTIVVDYFYSKKIDNKGRRRFYSNLWKECQKNEIKVEKGIFGAHMKVDLQNDGPVTIILDSEELNKNY